MALTTELITGHGSGEHVTSFDARAFNRSVFGKGKYIFQDAENLKVQISAITGTIQISAGSCLWSGMHIRVAEEGSIKYTTPASTDYVYVWLHYVRNPEDLVESVEFTTTTSSKPETKLIADTLTDEMTEAYTLFCSFSHDTSTNSVVGLTNDFSLRQPLDDTSKSLSSSMSAFQTSVSDQFRTFTDDVEATLENAENTLINAVHLGTSKADGWIIFTESILNFAFVLFSISYNGIYETRFVPRSYLTSAIPLNATMQDGAKLCAISIKLTKRSGAESGTQYGVGVCNAYVHEDKGTLGGGYTQTEISRSSISISAYGVNRIKGA